MTLPEFLSVIRAAENVEPFDVPGLTTAEQRRMAEDPIRFLKRADDERRAAIWRLMADQTRVPLTTIAAPRLMAAE